MKVEEIKLAFEANVQFAVLQEIEQRALNNSKSADILDKDFTSFMQLKTKIKGDLKRILLENNSLLSKIEQTEKTLKELGADTSDLFKSKKYASDVDSMIKNIDSKVI